MLLFEKDICGFSEEEIIHVLCNMGSKINDNYIYDILSDKETRIIFYSIGGTPDIYNCPSSLIYKVEKTSDNINVYILFIATAYRFRKVGYASMFMKEFIAFINGKYNKKYQNKKQCVKIILDSIQDAVTFYEHIGFKWIITNEYNEEFKIAEDFAAQHFIMVHELT